MFPLVLIYRSGVTKYPLSRSMTLVFTVIDRIYLGPVDKGSEAMMGFETLAIVLFVGWVLATSLFLRFG
jgi:hypothetical protein